MAQDYDKIFKENIEEIILPLAERLLGIHPERLEEIPDDLQRTIERKPDFLKKVSHQNSSADYILHIEFQTEDDDEMVYRMNEYYALLLRKYKLDIRQYVFFIGKGVAKMATRIERNNLSFQFGLINLQTIDYHSFINSETPEEVILAILADFGNDKPETVVQSVLRRIKELPNETLRKEKCVKQLEILSNLRNLQAEIINQLANMALIYDIKKDLRYQQGVEETQKEFEAKKKEYEETQKELQQIIQETQKEFKETQKEFQETQKEFKETQKEFKETQKEFKERTIHAIKKMFQKNMAAEEIANILDVSLDFVQQIALEINTKKED